MTHIPVLQAEVIDALAPRPGETHVDGTFGGGGYARAILEAGARLIAFDRDPGVRPIAEQLARAFPDMLEFRQQPFSALAELAPGSVEGVVLDIGVSSFQIDDPARGFSFQGEGPLDMRMQGEGPSAADLVNQAAERDLAHVFRLYGEERHAPRIARAIVRERAEAPIETTAQLAAICQDAYPKGPPPAIHPATRVFQALRIAVNDELGELERALAGAERVLAPGGRLVVVTFHSLEDRIVKRFLHDRSKAPSVSRHAPANTVFTPIFSLPFTKPKVPGDEELSRNRRARSAKLRAGVRTAAPPSEAGPASAWPNAAGMLRVR